MQLLGKRNSDFQPIKCLRLSILHFVLIDLLSLLQQLSGHHFCLCMLLGFINCPLITRTLFFLSSVSGFVPCLTTAVAFSFPFGESSFDSPLSCFLFCWRFGFYCFLRSCCVKIVITSHIVRFHYGSLTLIFTNSNSSILLTHICLISFSGLRLAPLCTPF